MDQHTSSHPSGLPTREEAEKQPPKIRDAKKDTMYLETFFPTCIYYFDHPTAEETNRKLKKDINLWEKRDEKGIVRSNSLGWHSAVDMHHRSEYNHFTKWLFEKVNEVYLHQGYDPRGEAHCDNMWANINKRYSHNRNHVHPGCLWSGVYYVQTPESSGRIWFTDPRGEAHVIMPHYKERQPFTWREVYYEPVPGRLILFPAWLTHEVEPNINKEFDENDDRGWRYSLSFNFNQKVRQGENIKQKKGHDSGGGIFKEDLE